MTVHDFIEKGWIPSHYDDRIRSLTEIRDFVIVLTDSRIYRAQSDQNTGELVVYMIGHL